MNRVDIFILANSQTVRALRRVPGDPSLGKGRDGDHIAEITLDPAVAKPAGAIGEPSDRPGRFEKGETTALASAMAYGERHGEAAERDRRQIKAVAESIRQVLGSRSGTAWGLVAPAQLLGKIEDALAKTDANSLVFRQSGDYTGEPLAKIEARLLTAGSA